MDAFVDTIADKYEEEPEVENEPIEVSYYEYVNNKGKYNLVPKSYDREKKTCKVTLR